jgi:hypothetical protein
MKCIPTIPIQDSVLAFGESLPICETPRRANKWPESERVISIAMISQL